MMLKKSILVILAFIFIQNLFGQDTTHSSKFKFLEPISFSRPFISEIHSTINKIEFGFNKSYSEFDLLREKSRFERPMVELHLGYEAPLLTYNMKKNIGFGLTLPVSVHVLEDMWGPETAPVINTDYRFGGPRISGYLMLNQAKFLKNISFSWLTIFHECTHLGDEIVIYRKDENFPITRINVSYEYTEFQLTLNDPGLIEGNAFSLRLGGLIRISDRGLGWYSARPGIETDSSINLTKSKNKTEYYCQLNIQRSKGFLASESAIHVFSMEARSRVRYGYPIYTNKTGVWEAKEIKESNELCLNIYSGYNFKSKKRNSSLGLFLHAYWGLNPYGQLRNYPSYPFYGLSMIYIPN